MINSTTLTSLSAASPASGRGIPSWDFAREFLSWLVGDFAEILFPLAGEATNDEVGP